MAKFAGFSPKVLTFFRELEKNNDRNWFAARKEFYEAEVRGPMVELVGVVGEGLRKIAADYVPERPEKAMYRIYRDTRFSKDKTPYKTHMGVHFQHRRIVKNRGAGFYFEVSHQGVGIGGGMYMPGPEELLAVREKLVKDWRPFAKLCSERSLVKVQGTLQGESLARVPKGMDVPEAAGEWVRRKQFYFFVELEAKLALTPKLYDEVMKRFEKLIPFNEYLNRAVIEGIRGEDEEIRPVRPEPMF